MRQAMLAAVVAGAVLAGGCGDDSDEPAAAGAKPASKPAAKANLDKDPHGITCADLDDPVSRRVTVALANELLAGNASYAEDHNLLQTSQSIYLGMTELCKSRDAAYKPSKEAVRGVERGEWKAEL